MIMSLHGRTWRGRFTMDSGESIDTLITIRSQQFTQQIATQWQCLRHRCTFYSKFLKEGPATLEHNVYHSFQSDFLCWREIHDSFTNKGQTPPREVCNNVYRLALLLRLI